MMENKLNHENVKKSRRDFFKTLTGLAVSLPLLSFLPDANRKKELPMRVLGRTGEKVSLISIGGFHVGDPSVSEDEAISIIRTAIDRGVNFMDNAWSYKNGRSEELMGLALKDGYRKKVLLMTKIMARTVEEAKIQMETSLKRFKLDNVDLLQFHAVGNRLDDVDRIYNDGIIKWAEDQRSQGVFKYIGFTGHHDPQIFIDMIKRGYPWDTVQMPLNIADHHRELSFEKHVLPLALENNIGIIGMKSNGMGRLGNSKIATPTEGLRYSMSLPVSTVVSGIDSMKILEENLALCADFKPLPDDEKAELLARSVGKLNVIEHYRRL